MNDKMTCSFLALHQVGDYNITSNMRAKLRGYSVIHHLSPPHYNYDQIKKISMLILCYWLLITIKLTNATLQRFFS